MALSLALLFASGLLLFFVKPHRWRHAGWVAAIPPALITGWQLAQMVSVSTGTIQSETYAWVPSIGLEIALRLDGLALLFGLVVTGMGAFVALYTGYYFEDDERQGQFYFLLFAFMASMLGLVWSDNLLALFCFWEGTSITSYLMIAFKTTSKSAREGGRRAFIVTGLGGLAMLGGFILLGMATGSYSISGMVAAVATTPLAEHPLYGWALALVLLGAFTKSAQFPFHFWLPGAMAAPTPASAYLHSATMVKAGIFLLARLHPALGGTPEWVWTVTTIGAITMLLGAVTALRYRDLKAILAYATVSQLGMLTMLLGMSVKYAPTAVALGILAHSLYKGPLFLAAGIVDHATGVRDIRRLFALARPMPTTAAAVVLAAYSMAGIPVSLGFLAKEYALGAGEQAGELWAAATGWSIMLAIAVTGAFFFAIAVTVAWDLFFRKAPATQAKSGAGSQHHDGEYGPAVVHHAPSLSFVLPALLPAALAVVLPFLAGPMNHLLIEPAATAIWSGGAGVEVVLWHGVTIPLLLSLSALVVGYLLFTQRARFEPLFAHVPAWLSGTVAFAWLNDATYGVARWTTRTVMGGTLAAQVSVTLLAASLVAISAFVTSADWAAVVALPSSGPSPLYEALLALLAIIAAVIAVRSRKRLSAIIALGVVGWTVTLYFIVFSAPDLALTQLLIETLTVVLLVLVFFRVGPDRLPPPARRTKIYRWFVSLAAGLFGFTMVLYLATVQYGESIAPYFTQFSVPVGQGGNVVNVILVDFRGYDTMGEVTVLVIAALGGLALWNAPRMSALRDRYLRRLRSFNRTTATDTGQQAVPLPPDEQTASELSAQGSPAVAQELRGEKGAHNG
jgi:multicomponent Na+:H+ antiporter subunit A